MTENEAKIFIQNAMEQSKNVLAELMLIMPKVFAVRKKNLGEYYSNLENCKKEIQSCEVAIKALEEVQKYRKIEKDLKERYHANVDIPLLMHHFIETVFEGEKHGKSTRQSARRKNYKKPKKKKIFSSFIIVIARIAI